MSSATPRIRTPQTDPDTAVGAVAEPTPIHHDADLPMVAATTAHDHPPCAVHGEAAPRADGDVSVVPPSSPSSRVVIGNPTAAGIHPPAAGSPTHPTTTEASRPARPWGKFRDDTSTHLGIGEVHPPPPGRLAPPTPPAPRPEDTDPAPTADASAPAQADAAPLAEATDAAPLTHTTTAPQEAPEHILPLNEHPPTDEQRIVTDLGDAVVYQAGYTEQQRKQRSVWRLLVITGSVMAVVFVISALAFWGQVRQDQRDSGTDTPNPSNTCALPPNILKLNVYNAAGRTGIAKKVADDFTSRKFVVDEIDNDPREKILTGVAEIRHGDYTYGSALKVAQYIPGSILVRDERKNAQVDVAIGTGFTRVVNPPKGAAPVPVCSQ